MNKKIAIVCFCMIQTFLFSTVSYAVDTLYRLPLASNPGYYAWFDHNDTSAKLLRFDCATSFQYDNHHGTDFKCSTGTAIYAGAKGDISYVYDLCKDNVVNYGCGGGYGNHVKMLHADGRVTIYAHMKQGTATAVKKGILCGAYLGKSGNTGYSTAPHLHFDLWQNVNIGTRLDFYAGQCSSHSYWLQQNGNSPNTTCQ